MPDDPLASFEVPDVAPDCMECGERLARGRVDDLVRAAGPEERAVCEAQAGQMEGVQPEVWLCRKCSTVYPVAFSNRMYGHGAHAVRNPGYPDCPVCRADIEMLGHSDLHRPRQKIFFCRRCTENVCAASVFGFVRPEGATYQYFTRLSPEQILERLEYVEGGGRPHSLAEFRDLFDRDPEYVFSSLPDRHKPFGFILAYAYDYDPEQQKESRLEDVGASLASSEFSVPPCPYPRKLKEMVLRPDKVLLDIVPRRALGGGLLYVAVAVLIFAIGAFPFMPPLSLLAGMASAFIAFFGYEVRVTGWRIVVENGQVSVTQKGWMTGDVIEGISRIEKIEVQLYARAPMAHVYVDVSDPDAGPPNASEQAVVEGLRVHHHGRTKLIAAPHNFAFLMWVGRAMLEGAKAQGSYVGPREPAPATPSGRSRDR